MEATRSRGHPPKVGRWTYAEFARLPSEGSTPLSPSTAHRDRGVKLERYRHFGVPEYWIVDLDARAVEVWRLAEAADAPEVVGASERLRWRAVEGGPTFEAPVEKILAGA